MSNKLTIHFHLKHYKESSLSFVEYFLLLLYENRNDWTVSELGDVISQSDRTIARMRVKLVSQGYLQKGEDREGARSIFLITDKLYKNERHRSNS